MRKNVGTEVQTVKEWLERKNSEHGLRPDHPLQRYAKQWKPWQTGNLMRRILEEKRIPNILIAEQDDQMHPGCTISWLLDGKQRITTIERYINNEFSISKSTRNSVITYQGYTPETKIVRGKEVIVHRKDGSIVYKVDEDGKKIFGEQKIDIVGKMFKHLPDELQKRILNYNIEAIILYECTNEDIQNEIRDYNSGSQMNVAQIGVNALGVEWATAVRELSNHSFIKDCCNFSDVDNNSSKTMRVIGESFMSSYFIEDWNKSNEAMCVFLANNLTQSYVDDMRRVYDILEEIMPHDSDIVSYINFKEFFVIIANFIHFLEIEKDNMNYSFSCYADFIREWVRELKDVQYNDIDEEDEWEDDDNEPLTYEILRKKQAREPHVVLERVRVMNKFLDEYLEENCEDFLVESSDDLFIKEIDGTNDAFISIEEIDDMENSLSERFTLSELEKINFNTKLTMLSADVPLNSFDNTGIEIFRNRFVHMDDEEKGVLVDSAQYYAEKVDDVLSENFVDENDEFITESNILALARLYKMFELNGQYAVDKYEFSNWLIDFKDSIGDTRFEDILEDDVLGKANYMYDKYIKYTNGEVA